MNDKHIPVLLNEVLHFFQEHDKDADIFIDCTFGNGGHSKGILNHCKGSLYAFDRDITTLKRARDIKEEFQDRFYFSHACFSDVPNIWQQQCEGPERGLVSGILMDIGVSSMQIDDPSRGFSFMRDGPLLMTMGKNNISAADIVNTYAKRDLVSIFENYGEERRAFKIAEEICFIRKKKTIKTTFELVEIIQNALKCNFRGPIHPATKVFQALRIAVNEELQELETALLSLPFLLKPLGVLAIITFQGLEDKVVKKCFNYCKNLDTNAAYGYTEAKFSVITKNVIRPKIDELRYNSRARSAKLRVLQRIM